LGDHKQLSLEATGLGFSISKKLDRYIWEKFRPNNMSYDQASKKKFIVNKIIYIRFFSF
jgi:hypothetical protein